ncbi:MAG: ferritin-like domain-containing protein [Proteiniphilum sp.]|jgi:ferritin-like metal-binding protein YciE|uniref:YciE/YciF ferroxidase family protein n=1 Tax=Proteiniphilum sp. TaxID=1926877 RepID=UPI002B1FB6C8|nr:ferritin-like domain-containing protein [Proteiniphilum sp.]MEA5127291.1 ferritin-like domain-containing protein [Proteiniphilum sp.]
MDSINQSARSQLHGKDITKNRQSARFNEKFSGKLKEFFVEELKDIYFAEEEILKGLDKMEAAAVSLSLKESIRDHHRETEEQIERLKEIFQLIGKEPSKKKCEAIIGILKEGETMIEDTDEESMVRDAAIIIACQKVEHYEIATYGSLAELARTLGLDEVADILEETLEEEKSTDVGLTELAVESVNEEAKEEGEETIPTNDANIYRKEDLPESDYGGPKGSDRTYGDGTDRGTDEDDDTMYIEEVDIEDIEDIDDMEDVEDLDDMEDLDEEG